MNFAEVLRELELEPVKTDVTDWENWAAENGLSLPVPFLEGLRLGAADLLTQYSNDEELEQPQRLRFFWEGQPVVPLLSENQGNYVYGLHLNGLGDPPVLLCHEWEYENRIAVNLRWKPFAENFAAFAFARLFDYQYRWTAGQEGWEEGSLPFSAPPLDSEKEARMNTYFKRGPTTPEVLCLVPGGSRQRFYRSGQRVSFTRVALYTEDPDEPHWEWYAANPQADAELVGILTEVLQ